VEVAGDATGDLVQVSGLSEQVGQVVQLPGRELVEGVGDGRFGGIAQQDKNQVAVPSVAAVQPGATTAGGLLAGELVAVRHQGSPPVGGRADQAQPSRRRPPLGYCAQPRMCSF
jgi:hypothetical protein